MKPHIIPIFIPHLGCPHRCVFCDQRTITGVRRDVTGREVADTIARHAGLVRSGRKVEVAFYGGSFTALPAERQLAFLTPAKAAIDCNIIHSIRVSTRPDAIDGPILERLLAYGVKTVELGVQSLDDTVLRAAERGHSRADALRAAAMVKAAGLECGLQLMPGLPGEDWNSLIDTGLTTAGIAPAFTRIYPTVVVKGTKLADLYAAGRYRPLTLAGAISRAAFLRLLFDRHGIGVIRTGLQPTAELSCAGVVLAGPYHPAFGEMVEAFIFNMMVSVFLDDLLPEYPDELLIKHHPQDHSKVRGQKNNNFLHWQNRYQIRRIKFAADWPVAGELAVRFRETLHIINKSILFNK